LFIGIKLMEWKLLLGESGAQVNEVARLRTFRTDVAFSRGNFGESLPDIAAMAAPQRDIDAGVERALRGTENALRDT
jgi:hypothetical protein